MDRQRRAAGLVDSSKEAIGLRLPAGREPEDLIDVDSVAGEGPVAGFVLDLRKIWEGL